MQVPLGNWNLFLNLFKWLSFKEQVSERECKRGEEKDKGNFDAALSTTLPKGSAYDDNPVSNSLGLTSPSLYSTVIPKWCLIKEWWIKG